MATLVFDTYEAENILSIKTNNLENLFPKVKFDSYFVFVSILDLVEFKFAHNVQYVAHNVKYYFKEFDLIQFYLKINIDRDLNLKKIEKYIVDKKNNSEIHRFHSFYDKFQSEPDLNIKDFYDVAVVCEKEKFSAPDVFKQNKNDKVIVVEKFMDLNFGQTEWAWKVVKAEEKNYYRPVLLTNFLPEMFIRKVSI